MIWWGASESLSESARVLTAILDRVAMMPDGQGWFAVAPHGGAVLGNVMVQPARSVPGETEIGWHFSQVGQGRGYATEASAALMALAFEQLALPTVIAPIVPTHASSQRVATKLGMVPGERIDYAGYLHDVWAVDAERWSKRKLP